MPNSGFTQVTSVDSLLSLDSWWVDATQQQINKWLIYNTWISKPKKKWIIERYFFVSIPDVKTDMAKKIESL